MKNKNDKSLKPKICFVTREYAHYSLDKTGGIGVFVKQFTQALKSHEFEITVFTFGIGNLDFMDQGVKVHKIRDLTAFNDRIKKPFQKYHLPGYITLKKILEYCNRRMISYKLSKFLTKQNFDVIEFHDYGGDAPFVKTKIPMVIRCHGTAVTLHEFMDYPLRSQDAYYERLFFKRIHAHVVAVSEYSASTTQKAFGLKEIPEVIYNGVCIPDSEKKDNYLEAPTIPYSIWYFGSIRERKGVDIACKVFNEVLKEYPKATFHVMGNNNNDHWNTVCVKLLSSEALEKTTYYGTVPNEQVNDYIQKAHVVLFPSFGENFSIALLEVMALGKIVITSDIPAFKEIVVHQVNGITVKDEQDYLEWIRWVFEHPKDWETLSENAKQTIANRFDMDLIIKQNIQFYKSVIKNG